MSAQGKTALFKKGSNIQLTMNKNGHQAFNVINSTLATYAGPTFT